MEARVAQDGLILTEAQMIALERKKEKRESLGEIETMHPGYLGSQDTYYVGTIKGVGRIYQQTFIDTYSRVAFSKLYDCKTALTAADTLNDQVLPFFEAHSIPLLRILTDRGTELKENRNITNTSSICRLKALSTARFRFAILKPMASVNGYTGQCRKSSMPSPSGRSCTTTSMTCRRIWIPGWGTTITSVHTAVGIVTEKLPCKRLLNPYL